MRGTRSPQDGPQVISRLQALFGPNSPSRSASPATISDASAAGPWRLPDIPVADGDYGGADVTRSASEPAMAPGDMHTGQSQSKPIKDRHALLVKVVTWNMGDALPKGDLSVLLGSVPDYVPLPTEDGFPVVPIEDAHPYHIVVVAGQECPTESGVPRGLGGGVLRGMKLGTHIRKDKKDKEKEKDKDRAKEGKEGEKEEAMHLEEVIKAENAPDGKAVGDGKDTADRVENNKEKGEKLNSLLTPAQTDDADSSESTEVSRTASPVPGSQTGSSSALGQTPSLHRHQHNAGGKGWSTMLDDWLCGPIKTAPAKEGSKDDKPPRESAAIDISITREPDSLSTPATPILSPNSLMVNSPFLRAEAPGMARSSSSPLNVPGWSNNSLLGVTQQAPHPLGHSPLARSPASFASLASVSDSSDSEPESGASHAPSGVASAPMSAAPSAIPGSPRKAKPERPALIIPTDGDRPEGTKCYLHLVKERLMGMYLSIYVHRDCRDLIGGMDKDFVTTGLAGGRLGNKGGIGISLKIADHRLLFVNSHLAAHTSRNGARLANIAKIKADLQLDCFLPKSDPRAMSEDIADRFDTVFWCGDLNFRLDMSRLHAEWLVEQKKYDEALTWDQLKMAMKDPGTSPFPGFEEGLINFPPTFKYDVWKSARATNRELRRSLKRRGSIKDSAPPDVSKSIGTLGHVPESGAEELEDDLPGRMSEDDAPRRSIESGRSARSASRASNALSDDLDDLHQRDDEAMRNGLANSHRPLDVTIKEKTKKMFGLVKLKTALTPSPSRKAFRRDSKDRRESPKAGHGHPHPFSAVRKDTGTSGEGDFDVTSRRTSLSSLASMRDAANSPRESEFSDVPPTAFMMRSPDPAAPVTPTHALPDPLSQQSPSKPHEGRLRRPTVSSQASPPRAGRSFSLKRTMSGKSAKLGTSVGSSAGFDQEEDNREGVYDSSKKQRVPSWCDRVLWKAHPEPDPEPELEPAPVLDHSVYGDHSERSRPFGRLSAALHTLGGHLKPQISRTPTNPPESTGMSRVGSSNALDRIRTAQSSRPDRAGSVTPTLVDSPISSPAMTPKLTGLVPLPLPRRRSRSRAPRSVSPGVSDSRSVISSGTPSPEKSDADKGIRARAQTYDSRPKSAGGPTTHRHPLLSFDTSTAPSSGGAISPVNTSHPDNGGLPARPRITFEPASSPSADRSTACALPPSSKKTFRARANSDCHDTSARAKLASSIGLGPSVGPKKSSTPTTTNATGMRSSPSFPPPRRATDELLSGQSMANDSTPNVFTSSAPATHRAQPLPLLGDGGLTMSRSHTQTHIGTGATPVHAEERGAFARFLRDIPNWLHRHTSMHVDDPVAMADEVSQAEPARIKRHMKGEVVCMWYGTIDDAGMRALEGRSDHRPAIFSAAVYIDK